MLPVLLCLHSTCDRSELSAVLTLRDKSSDFCSSVASVSRERSTSGIEAPQTRRDSGNTFLNVQTVWIQLDWSPELDSLNLSRVRLNFCQIGGCLMCSLRSRRRINCPTNQISGWLLDFWHVGRFSRLSADGCCGKGVLETAVRVFIILSW